MKSKTHNQSASVDEGSEIKEKSSDGSVDLTNVKYNGEKDNKGGAPGLFGLLT